jgi:hypothetical protein
MKNQSVLYVVLALQGLLLAGQWLGQPGLSTAQAQVPDAGAQRIAILDELKATNARLDRIAALLESGNLQVRTAPAPADQPRAR